MFFIFISAFIVDLSLANGIPSFEQNDDSALKNTDHFKHNLIFELIEISESSEEENINEIVPKYPQATYISCSEYNRYTYETPFVPIRGEVHTYIHQSVPLFIRYLAIKAFI